MLVTYSRDDVTCIVWDSTDQPLRPGHPPGIHHTAYATFYRFDHLSCPAANKNAWYDVAIAQSDRTYNYNVRGRMGKGTADGIPGGRSIKPN